MKHRGFCDYSRMPVPGGLPPSAVLRPALPNVPREPHKIGSPRQACRWIIFLQSLYVPACCRLLFFWPPLCGRIADKGSIRSVSLDLFREIAMPKITVSAPVLLVSDVVASANFFRDAVGFR